MNIVNSFPALEMLRTNALHMGESQTLANPFFAASVKDGSEKKDAGFESYLIGALDYVNQAQLTQSAIAEQFQVDPDSLEIHQVTTALGQAAVSLEAANRIINQMISSWNEITTTR
jgi:flagellar hook-basal body complex protein FliE